MSFLSPAKLLIILLVALVVLGPDKLPTAAKHIGSLWGDFRTFREKLESEVRGNFPDLPSTDAITQAVRSPLSLLDTLAETHGSQNETASEGVGSHEPRAPAGATIGPDAAVNSRGKVPIVDSGNSVQDIRSKGEVGAYDPRNN